MVVSNWEYGVVITFEDLHDPGLLSHRSLCPPVFWYCLIIVLTLVVPPGIEWEWSHRCRGSSFIKGGPIPHFQGGISDQSERTSLTLQVLSAAAAVVGLPYLRLLKTKV